ncbi:MAG: alpha/beta hydrolase [Ardenticatenaceae bacterium]|nr:alpha/beta hydrolase [Ardenticatenaceae bacterium]
MMKRIHKVIRTIWLIGGILFLLWMVYSFQAHGVDTAVLQSTDQITVVETADTITFTPQNPQPVGLIFYPGGLVAPQAYAPLLRATAEQGYTAVLFKLPLRTASFGNQEADLMAATAAFMDNETAVTHWFVSGHSRGAAIAARLAHDYGRHLAGLILIGTSHPKEATYDLSTADFPITKLYATNDGLASVAEVQANARLLPDDTHFVEITGGNHAQFGYYGSQLGDNRATISRETQQALTLQAILAALDEAAAP